MTKGIAFRKKASCNALSKTDRFMLFFTEDVQKNDTALFGILSFTVIHAEFPL